MSMDQNQIEALGAFIRREAQRVPAPTASAITDAQIEAYMTMIFKDEEMPQVWFKRADVLRIVRAVLALAPVAGGVPAGLSFQCIGYVESFGTQIHDRPKGERSTPVYVLDAAPASPQSDSSPLDRQIARAQQTMAGWSPEKHASMQLQGPSPQSDACPLGLENSACVCGVRTCAACVKSDAAQPASSSAPAVGGVPVTFLRPAAGLHSWQSWEVCGPDEGGEPVYFAAPAGAAGQDAEGGING